MNSNRIAVLIPCYNEEMTIESVVKDFKAHISGADIYVYDNNSKDNTATLAADAGATVRNESYQGKGNVIRRMFSDIDADIYVMVDGDGTYDASSAPEMIEELVSKELDMVTGSRVETYSTAYPMGHKFGNRMFSWLVTTLFGHHVRDLFSGYRILSRRFVKSFPALSEEFEIETELTVHALELRMPVGEIGTPYTTRPEGSESKLSTHRDGLLILLSIFNLVRSEKPILFFGVISVVLALIALILAIPILLTYTETGLVPRFPTAILSTGLMIISILSLFTGLLLDSVTRGRRELRRLHYLKFDPVRKNIAE